MEHHLDLTSAVAIPYFNFAIFVIAFVVFFRKPLVNMARSRRESYLSASKEAAATLEQAKSAFAEVKQRLESLDSELAQFKKQSDSQASDEAKRLMEETERFTRQLKEETSKLAAEAIEAARQDLRHEVVKAARILAEKKIEGELDSGAKEKILKSRINDAASMSIQ